MINNVIIKINCLSSFKSRQRLDISNFLFYRICLLKKSNDVIFDESQVGAFLVSVAEWVRFSFFAATQTFSELNFWRTWKGHKLIIVVVDRPNCMDFIYRIEFEGVKIVFGQL